MQKTTNEFAEYVVLERGNVFMKKLLSFVLIIALMFSGCGAEKIGTDYDFSKVMEETMANIIENTPKKYDISLTKLPRNPSGLI